MKTQKFGKIEKIISAKCKNILESLELFDIYRNEKLGQNKKSVAYSIKFRSQEKTLSEIEINEIMKNIISDLEKDLKAELRK